MLFRSDEPLHEIDFVPFFMNIEVNYDPGETQDVKMHDGSLVRLRKMENMSYDATDKRAAIRAIEEAHSKGEVLTGILYMNPEGENFHDLLNTVDEPLATLPLSVTRPPKSALDEIMDELR